MAPRDVDLLEIWEIAVLLGHADELEDGGPPAGGKTPDRERFHAAAKERNRARLAAHRAGKPAPEAKPVDQGAFATLTKALK